MRNGQSCFRRASARIVRLRRSQRQSRKTSGTFWGRFLRNRFVGAFGLAAYPSRTDSGTNPRKIIRWALIPMRTGEIKQTGVVRGPENRKPREFWERFGARNPALIYPCGALSLPLVSNLCSVAAVAQFFAGILNISRNFTPSRGCLSLLGLVIFLCCLSTYQ